MEHQIFIPANNAWPVVRTSLKGSASMHRNKRITKGMNFWSLPIQEAIYLREDAFNLAPGGEQSRVQEQNNPEILMGGKIYDPQVPTIRSRVCITHAADWVGEVGELGLRNYKDTKPKCRLDWYLIEFID